MHAADTGRTPSKDILTVENVGIATALNLLPLSPVWEGIHAPGFYGQDYATLTSSQPSIADYARFVGGSTTQAEVHSEDANGHNGELSGGLQSTELDIQASQKRAAVPEKQCDRALNAAENSNNSILCDDDFSPTPGTSSAPNEVTKALDSHTLLSGNSTSIVLPAARNQARDIPPILNAENIALYSAEKNGLPSHLRPITGMPGVRNVVVRNRHGTDIRSNDHAVIIRENNPRIIMNQGGYKKFIWYWQSKSDGSVQLRKGYDIYVYETILDDCKVKCPIWNPKTCIGHAWELVQHLMGGDEGIIACYENKYDNQGADFLLGRNTLQAVLSYVTDLYKLQQPMKELTVFKAMMNNKLINLYKTRMHAMGAVPKKRKATDE
ncbi:uncharacterized protein LOC129597636 [Paramacrobiotus metropolitanus]|uniref:uncharacterized protein LOC129597636 n=1 Tax=Paramacrobiotus metropolitanus TaxID=2943436 RepID=UPI0024460F69|nr:uncharacterized protein LOC129597636 [Paramacrobiotus metropolitanus]